MKISPSLLQTPAVQVAAGPYVMSHAICALLMFAEDQAMLDVQPSSSTPAVRTEQQAAQGAAGPAATAGTAGTAGTKDPKQILEAVLVKMLSIYEQLANATVLLSAPQVTYVKALSAGWEFAPSDGFNSCKSMLHHATCQSWL